MSRRHNSFIRTRRGQLYVKRSLAAALSDPALRDYCHWAGGMFPPLEKSKPTIAQLEAIFTNRHPESGKKLKHRLSAPTRFEDGKEVSNTCHGFTATFEAPKTVSVATLVLGDPKPLEITCGVYASELTKLTKLADRRRPRPRPKKVPGVLPTGIAEALLVPEVVDRFGHPDLHLAATLLNLTSFADGDATRYCAIHFGRIAKAVAALRRRANRRLFHALRRAGYLVHGSPELWILGGIPKKAIEQWTTRRQEMVPFVAGAYPRVELNRRAQRRDDQHNRSKPAKRTQTLAAWQVEWRAELGEEQFKSMRCLYETVHAGHKQQRDRKRQHKSASTVGVVAPASDATDVLQPVPKAKLLEAVAGLRPDGLPAVTCREVVASSQQLCNESITYLSRGATRLRPVTVVADMTACPWLPTAAAILELSYPGVRFRITHQAGTVPALKMTPSLSRTDFGRLLAQGTTSLLAKFARVPPHEMRKLQGLMDCAHQAIRPPRSAQARTPAVPAPAPSQPNSPDPCIEMTP